MARKSGLSTIIGLGIVSAIFMAVMSIFYLQQIPTQEDLKRLEDDLRREHGLYLSAPAPLELTLLHPQEDSGQGLGLAVVCTMRPDIRRQKKTVEFYLARLADGILQHPDWRGKIEYVTASHTRPMVATLTRFAGAKADKKS